jgi:hypothetical protein
MALKTAESGYTALHMAAHNGNIPVVRGLLGAGADASLRSDDGFTALQIAQYHSLIPSSNNFGMSAMDLAKAKERADTVLEILTDHESRSVGSNK